MTGERTRSTRPRGRPVIVIGGPTASGKSEAALALAERVGGVIVNADSMQVYQELSVVTARPDAAMTASAPHRLFGVLSVRERCSAGRWREMAVDEIDRAHRGGKVPIVVGGTGLYLKVLIEGLAPMPEIPEAVVAEAVALVERQGPESLHGRLAEIDSEAALAIPPTDRQRIVRAWSVKAHTGRSLAEWQKAMPETVDYAFRTVLVVPPRDVVFSACDARFERMVTQGALDEVRHLVEMRLDPGLPAMKAVGVPEIASYLAGRSRWEEMLDAGRRATRRYAKRQYTWLRHQAVPDQTLDAQFSESLIGEIFPKIRQFLLTHGA